MAEPHCLACGSTDVEAWATTRDVEYASVPDMFDYVRCTACDTLSIAEVPHERLSAIYPPSYYSFSERQGLSERIKAYLDRRTLRRLLRALPGKQLAALDVGGGTGWMLSQACAVEPRLRRTVVVDLDAKAKDAALANGHEFHLGEVEGFASNGKFDLILLLNLIEHVRDPVATLAKMRELLTPDGRILIKTPNHDSWDARLFRHRSWGGYHSPRHWVIFTPESFRRAAAQAGLEVATLRMTQGAPFWAVSVLELLERRGLVRITASRPMCAHPLFAPLLVLFAALDLVRLPFARTSQMFAELTHRSPARGEELLTVTT